MKAPELLRTALNTAIGTRELSAWQPMPGIVWVQTRLRKHANRMAKRGDSRLLAWGMAGGYLKIYEFHHPLSWAERLIHRYTSPKHTANERLIGAASAVGSSETDGR